MQNKNPIFELVRQINQGDIAAESTLRKQITLKKNQEKTYFMLRLNQAPQQLVIAGQLYRCQTHHISVYQKCSDRTFGLSAFHYSAKLSLPGKKFDLHVYFDRFDRLRDCLLVEQGGAPQKISFDHEQDLQQISREQMAPVVDQLFSVLQDQTQRYEEKSRLLQLEIDRTSKFVFTPSLNRKLSPEARGNYTDALLKLIAHEKAYMKIALQPNNAIIKHLEDALTFLEENPTPVRKIEPKKVKKTVTVVHSAPTLLESKSKKLNTLVEKKEENEVDVILAQLQELSKQNSTASLLCQQYQLWEQCFRHVRGHMALNALIEQNKVVQQAQQRMALCIKFNVVSDVKKLVKIVRGIKKEWIIAAALGNKTEVLAILLKHYRGPMRFVHDLQRLIVIDTISTEVMALLLKNGADANVEDYAGRSLLYLACEKNDIRRVTLLIQHGANVNFQQTGGRIVAHELCLQTGAPKRKGVKVSTNHSVPTSKYTPLMLAVGRDYEDVALLLVQSGADLTIKNANGKDVAPYIFSPQVGRPFPKQLLTELVEKRGFTVNRYDLHGKKSDGFYQTPLHYAVQLNMMDWVEGLLALGANPNLMTKSKVAEERYSVIMSAAYRGYTEMLSTLISQSMVAIDKEAIELICKIPEELRDSAIEAVNATGCFKISKNLNDGGYVVTVCEKVMSQSIRLG